MHPGQVIIDVIIPAYNEESSIGKVIADLPKEMLRHIIVCDNASTDRTSHVASDAGAVVIPAPKKGYGSACLQGMEFVKSQNQAPDIVVDMQDEDFGWTVEMQVKAAKMKLKTTEVPVKYRVRIGKSKVSGTVKGTFLAGHKILWTIFKLM